MSNPPVLSRDLDDARFKPSAEGLDLRGLKCPLPALKTRAALRRSPPGAILDIACTDPMSVLDVPNVVREEGAELIRQESQGGVFRFRIRRSTPGGSPG